ncbi:hypothetical protein LCGC14_1251320 [marine sediment metagenome]|uniref:Uncharacterized protein n=1 Tax=marine sediment metagenome TaxID=412755 RepID=A0A0F9L6J3_9ZZZZ
MENMEREVVELTQQVKGIELFNEELKGVLFGFNGLVQTVVRIEQKLESVDNFCTRIKNGMAKIIVAVIAAGIIALLGVAWYAAK